MKRTIRIITVCVLLLAVLMFCISCSKDDGTGDRLLPDDSVPSQTETGTGTGETDDDTNTEYSFLLVLAKPDKSKTYKEPNGSYSYYGEGEMIFSVRIPYVNSGEKTVYDCLTEYDKTHDDIEFKFTENDGFVFISDIKYNGKTINKGTNYLILYNSEYCEYCINNISPAGKDRLFEEKEDNLKRLTLVVNGWASSMS